MKKVLHSLGTKLLMLLFILALTLSMPLSALAQSYQEQINTLKEKISKESIGDCHETLTQAFDLELAEFMLFLKTNFENKSSNSTLSNIAIQRYSEYKIRLEDLFALLTPSTSTERFIDDDVTGGFDENQYRRELSAYSNCKNLLEDYKTLAKDKMIEHIKNTASQKKSTIMIEKYKAINERLEDLNFAMAQMYANFVQFKNKLPFYNQNCVTK